MSSSLEAPAQPEASEPARATRGPGVGTRLVSLIGELCIIAGAVVGLYVVWQLFYTDVVADREQAEVVDELDWAYTGAITADEAEPDTGPQILPDELHLSPDTAPVMDEPAFTETFATFYVPRWGTDYVKPISQGVTRLDVLDVLGIGHYPGTGMPGAYGNFAISAHRTTYGKPFNRIAELQAGDALVVQTEDAWYVYRMTDHLIVTPEHVEVIAPNPYVIGGEADGHYITLTTCHPMFSAAERYIVHGELEYWAPTGNGVPPEILEEIPQP
ncbi:class E sortase [Demequina mangrovi]|uniref:Sortase A n=1 Tax=Demequina mangrovi TaxID=1043493 RepID=A0A1H6ZXX4_9MICO|nr:class E sortase [Demequina mangrovi]SEJ57024.1 sortase A [Demequina mangrovi]